MSLIEVTPDESNLSPLLAEELPEDQVAGSMMIPVHFCRVSFGTRQGAGAGDGDA